MEENEDMVVEFGILSSLYNETLKLPPPEVRKERAIKKLHFFIYKLKSYLNLGFSKETQVAFVQIRLRDFLKIALKHSKRLKNFTCSITIRHQDDALQTISLCFEETVILTMLVPECAAIAVNALKSVGVNVENPYELADLDKRNHGT